VGALIAGRRTYETSLPWWGTGGPHPPIPVFVVTHGLFLTHADWLNADLLAFIKS
jgi:hypothetical protein